MRLAQLFSAATVGAALALGLAGGPAHAQTYPARPVKFLVGFAPGSSIDLVARIVATHLNGKLGQPVIVENRPGSNGMIAAAALANAEPDGHTVLISNSSTITVNPLLYQQMRYDVQRDFAPVSLMVSVPFILTTNPDSDRTRAVHNVSDLMKLARSKPDSLSYGSAGSGNLTQLSFELLNTMAGVKMVHVPYKGSAAAQVGLLGKDVDAAFDNPAAMPQIKAGKLRAIAVSSAQRWPDLPNVPSVAEQGYPGYDISFWVGAFVPAKTPDATVKALHEAIKAAGDDPATRALLRQQGNILMLGPQPFAARIKSETEQYAEVIRRSGIRLD
jgi:tripartite-type tricarboxylate transporter receptor subunit TctC